MTFEDIKTIVELGGVGLGVAVLAGIGVRDIASRRRAGSSTQPDRRRGDEAVLDAIRDADEQAFERHQEVLKAVGKGRRDILTALTDEED